MWSIMCLCMYFFFNDTATTEIYTLSLHDALPILEGYGTGRVWSARTPRGHGSCEREIRSRFGVPTRRRERDVHRSRSEEHTSELQSRQYLVCRLLLEKKTRLINLV